MESLKFLAPALAVVALLFAFYKIAFVSKQDAGTERMKEIAAAINDGAKAFLFAEYKILAIFVVVLFIAIGLGLGSWITALCFLFGALFSILAGYIGMNVATKANVRTANAARTSGMNKALSIAFSGGSVMGMCVVGLGLLGGLLSLAGLLLELHGVQVFGGGDDGQLFGQQEVAGIAVGHLHQLALLALALYVLCENDFHS